MSVLLPLLVVLALIAINAIFVATEFALVGAPRAAIKRRARQGHPAARLVREIQDSPREQDRYLATSQLGITAASLGLGMYGERVIAAWIVGGLGSLGAARWVAAHALASVLAVVMLTYFHIVLGEMVPKTVALQRAQRVALAITFPLRAVKTILLPVVAVLTGIATGLLRLVGIERRRMPEQSYTTEELRYIVQESSETGSLQEEAGEMVLELFEFGELTLESVMVPRVAIQGIEVSASQPEIIQLLLAERHSRYPVYEQDPDHIVGHVHVKHLFARLLRGQPLAPVDYHTPLPFVPATTTLDQALASMRRHRVQMLVVMDEFGGTAGIATIEDLFAEVVGTVEVAGAAVAPEIRELPGGRLLVAGTVRLEELSDRLDIAIEYEDVTTVSGLVLALLGRPARVGDQVAYAGFRFRVTEVAERGVATCLVTPLGRPRPAPRA